MKIVICYNSEGSSNAIVSSTMHSLKERNIKGMDVERVNIDKRNFMKYLNKLEELNDLPNVIYLYEGNKKLKENIESKYSGIKLMVYGRDMTYKPERVPGNKLKTNVYLLADKMVYDYEYNYEEMEVYKVSYYNRDIKKVKRTAYDENHPRGDFRDCFKNKGDALEKLEIYFENNENIYRAKMCSLELKMEELKEGLAGVKKERKETLVRLGGL